MFAEITESEAKKEIERFAFLDRISYLCATISLVMDKNILKIKAVLLYLLNKFGNKVDYITTFKLLYLAQKQHLKIYGIPLLKDDFYAFKAGPAPSTTYNICKVADNEINKKTNIYKDLQPVSMSFEVITETKGTKTVKFIKAKEEAELIRLSKSNIKILDAIYDKYHSYTPSRLSSITHDSAWGKNWNPLSEPKVIPLDDIAASAKVSKEIRAYINDAASMNGLH